MDFEALRTSLLPPDAAGRVWAAIAVVLADRPAGPSILLIRRAARGDDPWSGQIACPGGRVGPHDRSPLDACIREAREEVGIDLAGRGQLLGLLPPRSPANRPGIRVAPFVWKLPDEPELRPGAEVVDAWYQPIGALPPLDREVAVSTTRGPLRTRAFVVGDAVVWGFTYRVLSDLLDRLGA